MARGISPAIGLVLLVACTVALTVTVGAMVYTYEPAEPASQVVVSGEVDDNRITLTLESGGPLDARDLSLAVEVGGDPLEKQPSVPAYSQPGFSGFPTGPFNAEADPVWEQGQSASLTIATTTNAPQPESGSRVVVRIYEGDLPIATVETTV